MTKGRPRIYSRNRNQSERIKRLAKIIELLKKQDYTHIGLIKETGYPNKSVYRYIEELRKLKFVTVENGTIAWSENKIILKNETELKLALDHSKRLVHSSDLIPRFSSRFPFETPWKLIFWEEKRLSKDDYYFKQHLKTGYNEIFQLMEKFSQKAKSLVPDPYDFFTNGAIPRDETGLINRSLKFSITDGVMPRGGGIVLEHLQSPEMQSPEISENDKKELKNMKSQLIGEISTLVSRVANYDNVLEGSCDACPSRYFSIKGT